MRNTLLAATAVLVLGAGAWTPQALAQTVTSQGVTSQTVTSQTVTSDTPVAIPHRARPARRTPVAAPVEAGTDGAPPTSAYTGGANVPLSQRATNIGPGTTRSEVAPRLPNPDASSNTPEALLRAAERSLSQGQTGAAQQALEMAETRVLSRTTEPGSAGAPNDTAMVQNIGAARRALGVGNRNGAQAAITAALASPVPPPGPAVTTTTVYPGTPYPGTPAYGVVPPPPPRGY